MFIISLINQISPDIMGCGVFFCSELCQCCQWFLFLVYSLYRGLLREFEWLGSRGPILLLSQRQSNSPHPEWRNHLSHNEHMYLQLCFEPLLKSWHCNTLHQSPAAAQPKSRWPSNVDQYYRERDCSRKKEPLSFTLGDPYDSKSNITARNDLWNANIIITKTLQLPYPHHTHEHTNTANYLPYHADRV